MWIVSDIFFKARIKRGYEFDNSYVLNNVNLRNV